MTQNVIGEEWCLLGAARIWASQALAVDDFIAWSAFFMNGYQRAFQLYQAGVMDAGRLCAAWDCLLFERTGCHFGDWTGDGEISFYPPGSSTW
jgi:hypothetical protein